ncbi:hypothetical protein TRIATDRAFT_289604 [Trichoderma atroviride IMI 206040]|uniref:Uncharacterized protein n=1 Tax=Hypocrea atroviridis (strain ATCC 20476 / IMI 206040) TaxID=452589 RepID=G9NIG7_HYPAI|nr:uncharacterized protein TRIATDRAFT_289604 [Trichoderma atroviride IMI 206040]EHK49579.1 hypothetical protein TRIATDRAFT_289604 [Trichoderma atroviride IMI 206040]
MVRSELKRRLDRERYQSMSFKGQDTRTKAGIGEVPQRKMEGPRSPEGDGDSQKEKNNEQASAVWRCYHQIRFN